MQVCGRNMIGNQQQGVGVPSEGKMQAKRSKKVESHFGVYW